MSGPNFNIVYFVPANGGGNVAVEFESGFKLTAGLAPDINHGRMSPTEYQKLGDSPAQTGNLQFFFSSDPTNGGNPDVMIQNVNLIDAEPEEYGATTASNGSIVPVIWRVYFTDFRDAYVAPRGGRLRWGIINPSFPASVNDPDDPDEDSSGDGDGEGGGGDGSSQSGQPQWPLANDNLIKKCLEAMGLDDSVLTDDAGSAATSVDPPRDLQWHGSHAPSELKKLLELCGLVFCPHLDGTATIEVLGGGSAPDLGGFTVASDANLPGIDRRGSTVIFTSAPNPVIVTENISGPNSSAWEFVIQDTDNTWQPITKPPAILQGLDPATLIQTNFKDLWTATPNVVARVKDQLYFCIRLNTDNYPPGQMPILTERYEQGPAGNDQSLPIQPTVPDVNVFMVTDPPSGPVNAFVDLDVAEILRGNVLIVKSDYPLGKLAAGGTDPVKNFQQLDDGDLHVFFSHEQLDGNYQPLYFEKGYTRDSDGTVTEMNDVSDALDSPTRDMCIYHRPQWQQYIVYGTDANGDALGTLAKEEAAVLLAASSVPARAVQLVGFASIWPSGQIPEVRFDQRGVSTHLKIQTWYQPSAGMLGDRPHERHLKHAEPDAAYPHQHKTQGKRASLGMSGSNQSVESIRGGSSAPAPAGVYMIPVSLAVVDGSPGTVAAQCSFVYNVTDLTGKISYGTRMTPLWARPAIGGFAVATHGMGYIDPITNQFVLATTDEVELTLGCSS